MTAKLDQQVGKYLADRFRHESRRSFLSKITRGLFALAGVSLPVIVRPYEVSSQPVPAGPRRHLWQWCGLHGPICAGRCHPQMHGNNGRLGNVGNGMARWVACCKNPQTNRWHCVRYADYCGRQGPTYATDQRNCDGKTPSGPVWCEGASGNYICTDVDVAPVDFSGAGACARGCHPDEIHCEPQE